MRRACAAERVVTGADSCSSSATRNLNSRETLRDSGIEAALRTLGHLMRNISKPVLMGGGAVLTAIVAFLAFGVFGVHTLFIDAEVAEDNPFAVSAEPAEAEDRPAAETTPGVTTITTGSFFDGDHPTSGTGLTITDGNLTFLRFEGFATDNGPDLNVYLRSSADPDDYIDLGDLKGNIGDQNYELPAGIDLDRYDFVDIWCVRFGVSFGSAQLSAA